MGTGSKQRLIANGVHLTEVDWSEHDGIGSDLEDDDSLKKDSPSNFKLSFTDECKPKLGDLFPDSLKNFADKK